MNINHTLTWGVSSDTGSVTLNGSQTETGGTEILVDSTFPGGSSAVSFPLVFPHTPLQAIFLKADKNLEIQVNSSSSPILTINLIAGEPYVWNVSGYISNPFSADVTVFFITCSATTRLRGKILKT